LADVEKKYFDKIKYKGEFLKWEKL
jgi:hypothetical protein